MRFMQYKVKTINVNIDSKKVTENIIEKVDNKRGLLHRKKKLL